MKKYNIAFLDFDGVLNGIGLRDWKNNRYSLDKDTSGAMSKGVTDYRNEWQHFDQDIFLSKINILIQAFRDIPDLKIVLSTSWRKMKSVQEFHNAFNCIPGWDFEIIGRTGNHKHNVRGHEINDWIILNKSIVNNYVIIDDETVDMLPSQSGKIVKTSVVTGIHRRDIERIQKKLLKYDIDGRLIKKGEKTCLKK